MTTNQETQEETTPQGSEISAEEFETSEDLHSLDSLGEADKEESRFKEGQILRFVRVRFPGNAKSFPFLIGKRRIEYGQKVVAMSDRGMAVGYVNSFPYEVPFNKTMLPVRSIAKVAQEEDIVKDQEAYRQQKDAEVICTELIEHFKLDMQLTHVEFTSFGKKAIFYFIAPARVDFRDLVKDLVGKLKTRIELRQISVRDRSASIGGLGPCGRELCCSSFLTKYGNVGIKMAKNQDLTLNFSKLNGVCGQLKCCLQYEDDVYREKRSRLPKEGDIISTHTGEIGRVDRLYLLSEQFVMMTNRGVRKRYIVDLYKETLDKEAANFPKEFDSISDETHKILGLEESEAKKVKAFESEVSTYKAKGKSFADNVFEDLFGTKSFDYSLPEIQEPDNGKRNVKAPEEEEEITYTMSEDEFLPPDEDYVIDDTPIRTRSDNFSSHDQGQRPHRDNRDRNHNNRGNQNRPPREAQGNNRDNRDNRDNRGPRRPQNNSNNNQNRPQGRGPQGNNQGRNRPQR